MAELKPGLIIPLGSGNSELESGMRKKRIAVALVGVNRSLKFTWPSIERELVVPFETGKFEVDYYLTLIDSGKFVSNPRSNERGWLDMELPSAMENWKKSFVSRNLLTREAKDSHKAAEALETWSYDPSTKRNFHTYLLALRHSHSIFLESEPYDGIIFARPDILIAGALRVKWKLRLLFVLSTVHKSAGIYPFWQSWGGLNDRFAIMTGPAAQKYFRRVEQLSAPQTLQAGSSEQLALHSQKGSLKVPVIHTPMFRIRIGGETEPRDRRYFSRHPLRIFLSEVRERLREKRRLLKTVTR